MASYRTIHTKYYRYHDGLDVARQNLEQGKETCDNLIETVERLERALELACADISKSANPSTTEEARKALACSMAMAYVEQAIIERNREDQINAQAKA